MKKSSIKISHVFFWAAVTALFFFAIARLYFRLTDDFRIANISYEMPYHQEWEVSPLNPHEKEELDRILDQNFSYIGKGAQSYAFGSEDGRYVIKFFKFKHLRPNVFVDLLPNISPFKQYKENLHNRKQRKLNGVFEGYRLAYSVHKKESGLLFIHLNKTHNLHKTIEVYDKIGLSRRIDLDKVVFIIQEKAKTTRTIVNEALRKGDLQEAVARINQIFDLYLIEYKKGIFDKDHGVMHNTGFVDKKPIHLDIGKLTAAEEMKRPEIWQQDMERIAWKFAVWTKETYPQDFPLLSKAIEEYLSSIFNRPFEFANSTPPPRKRK